jgi:hypothetical protein
MDKNKIIDDILNEWAMRSHDGLVSGHDTPENIEVLNEILAELDIDAGDFGVGIGDGTADEETAKKIKKSGKLPVPQSKFIKKDKITKKQYVTGHKNYKDGTLIDDIKSGNATFLTPSEKANLPIDDKERQARIDNDIWEDFGAPNGKAVGSDYVEKMKDAVKRAEKVSKVNFVQFYNKCSIAKAKEIYESTQYKTVIDAINSVRHQGLGRGELAFAFLLKGVKSGGMGDVDLINVEGYGKVEVKEVGNKGTEKVRISSSTLAGFSRSEFKNAIEDLASMVRRDKEFGNFLIKILSGKNPDGTYLYPHQRTPTKEETEMLTNFVEDPKTADMPKNLFRALVIISAKLQSSKPSGTKKDQAKIAVAIGQDKKEFGLSDTGIAKQQLDMVAQHPESPQKVTLTVSPSADESDKDYVEMAKSVKFFEKNYNLKTISEEITNLVSGKYKGMLIVSGGAGKLSSGEEAGGGPNKANIVNTSDIELEFDSMAMNGIVCSVKTELSKLVGT